MDKNEILARAKEYVNEEKDQHFRQEVEELIKAENIAELEDRFYQNLEFGTGGLIGIIGGGTNRMNTWMINRATQGLANYFIKTFPEKAAKGELSAVIAYDSRRFSDVFAEATALIFAANGFKTYLFTSLRPTPELSFAIRTLGCDTGVVVTASHNPPQYNGYKAYWNDGAQVIEPHDTGIIDQVNSVDTVKTISKEDALASGKLVMIDKALNKTNACVLSHDEIMCPADKLLYEVREQCGLEDDLNLLAASIAAKKLASGAKVVLVDIKFGYASIVKTYEDALDLAKLLRYIFKKSKVESVIVLTNTLQTIGEGVGNAVEVCDALKVLQGRKCLLRDVSIEYATEMILKADKKLKRKDVKDMVSMALDNGSAYNQFLRIVKSQGGDHKCVADSKLFVPYKSINFVAEKEGIVGNINSLMLGELIRRLCAETHDNNIGIVQRTKIGDYVKKGDIIVSFYYKDDADLEKYKNAIAGCIRVTSEKLEPVDVIKKVIR